jgi:ABC-type transport system involved in multi-copper enzyme maturation permease subunit
MTPSTMTAPRPGGDRAVPPTSAMIRTLAGVTLKRLVRGKALWIAAVLAALPVVLATVFHAIGRSASQSELFAPVLLLFAVLPALLVGASVGEDIEDRTSTYLWSRPIARWAVLAGKLLALTPIVVALIVGGWVIAAGLAAGPPSVTAILGLAAGAIASSLVVAGIAVVVPRHGMALTIAYMLVDLFVGGLPFSAQQLSITYQTRALAGMDGAPAIAAPLIGLAVIAGVWTAIGLRRIRRIEV